ncbi:6853_t:CDS:2 [Funneliformis mosseae]|uniref:6853_t:CDS:1 n=1 Tax=Funneliformis mosseae TaxID=27381 RepID=A0A9N9C6S5_FUNMO|nr:6853_t:CDS:2 [Funneliformis mosseae]
MLIAFMGGVYKEAVTKGRQALLRYRANQIADYEALCHFHLWPQEPDPKYIYYIGQSINFENWHKLEKTIKMPFTRI